MKLRSPIMLTQQKYLIGIKDDLQTSDNYALKIDKIISALKTAKICSQNAKQSS
jgi:hypothetical protein